MIDSNFLLLILKNKNQHNFKAIGGNLICPACKVRTKLYKLSDGRRKCKRCNCKFSFKRKTNEKKIKQLADCIVGFCLDFSARKTSKLLGHRYRETWLNYMKLRQLIAEESSKMEKLKGVVEADGKLFGRH